jgi:hypothetical protein
VTIQSRESIATLPKTLRNQRSILQKEARINQNHSTKPTNHQRWPKTKRNELIEAAGDQPE